MERITATEASRRFSDILNRAKYGGESFIVERNGEPMAEIRPAKPCSTVADLIAFLRENPPDPDFERDMREVIAQRDAMPLRDPWGAGPPE